MLYRAEASRADAELARVGLGVRQELGERLYGQIIADQQQQWHPRQARDMDQVARRVERQRWIEGDTDGIRSRGRQNRVAVRRCIDDALGADIAAGSRPVLEHKGLAEPE